MKKIIKSLCGHVVNLHLTLTAIMATWAIGAVANRELLRLSGEQIVNTCIALFVSGIAVTGIMFHSWARKEPFVVTWLHLAVGVMALGSACAALWLWAMVTTTPILGLSHFPKISGILWTGAVFLAFKQVQEHLARCSK